MSQDNSRIRWEFLCSGCWHTESWDMILERRSGEWVLFEGGRQVKIFPKLQEAKSWAQNWRDGKVIR